MMEHGRRAFAQRGCQFFVGQGFVEAEAQDAATAEGGPGPGLPGAWAADQSATEPSRWRSCAAVGSCLATHPA